MPTISGIYPGLKFLQDFYIEWIEIPRFNMNIDCFREIKSVADLPGNESFLF